MLQADAVQYCKCETAPFTLEWYTGIHLPCCRLLISRLRAVRSGTIPQTTICLHSQRDRGMRAHSFSRQVVQRWNIMDTTAQSAANMYLTTDHWALTLWFTVPRVLTDLFAHACCPYCWARNPFPFPHILGNVHSTRSHPSVVKLVIWPAKIWDSEYKEKRPINEVWWLSKISSLGGPGKRLITQWQAAPDDMFTQVCITACIISFPDSSRTYGIWYYTAAHLPISRFWLIYSG